MGLLEILLSKQPVQDVQILLKVNGLIFRCIISWILEFHILMDIFVTDLGGCIYVCRS